MNDATACLQLIVQQLKAQEVNKAVWKFMRDVPSEEVVKTSKLGLELIQAEARKKIPD